MNRRCIKRVSAALLIFVLITSVMSFNTLWVNAQRAVSFSLDSISVNNNRLFDVYIYAEGGCSDFSACKLMIDYDSGKMSFRSAASLSEESEIKYSDNNGRLTLVFLNEKGVDITKKSCIAKLTFMAQTSGTSTVNIAAEQCISSRALDLPIGLLSGAEIKISDSGKAQAQQKATTADRKNNGAENNPDNTEALAQSNGTTDSITTLDLSDGHSHIMLFVAGAGTVTVLFGVFVLSFWLGMRYRDKKESSQAKDDIEKNSDKSE